MLQAGHATYPNPVGFLPRHGWYSNLLTVIFALSVVTAIGVVASVFARRRGASHERRQQLAWPRCYARVSASGEQNVTSG